LVGLRERFYERFHLSQLIGIQAGSIDTEVITVEDDGDERTFGNVTEQALRTLCRKSITWGSHKASYG